MFSKNSFYFFTFVYIEVCTFPSVHSHWKLPCADCMEKEQLSKAIKMEMYCNSFIPSGLNSYSSLYQTQDMSRQNSFSESTFMRAHASTPWQEPNIESNARYDIFYKHVNNMLERLRRVVLSLIKHSNSPAHIDRHDSITISRLEYMLTSSLLWTWTL